MSNETHPKADWRIILVLLQELNHRLTVFPRQEPLNSGDDVSDEEDQELFDTENVVVCQYDKVRNQTTPVSLCTGAARLVHFQSTVTLCIWNMERKKREKTSSGHLQL